MIAYPDTSFLCNLYRTQEHSKAADAHRAQMTEPLHATTLLEFEFLQSINLQVFLNSCDAAKGFGRREADAMIADWESDIATGLVKLVPFDMDAVLREGRFLSSQQTARGGHRTMDVLHVATAVHLRARDFLSFDERQRHLAKAGWNEGSAMSGWRFSTPKFIFHKVVRNKCFSDSSDRETGVPPVKQKKKIGISLVQILS